MDIYGMVSIAIVFIVILMIFTSKSKTTENFGFKFPSKKSMSRAVKKTAASTKKIGKKIAAGTVGLVNKISKKPAARKETQSEENRKMLLALSFLADQKKIFTLYLIKKTLAKIAYLNVLIRSIKNIKSTDATLMTKQINVLKKRINLQVYAIKFYLARTQSFICQTTSIFYQLELQYNSIVNKEAIALVSQPVPVVTQQLPPVVTQLPAAVTQLPATVTQQLPVVPAATQLPVVPTESETPESESETPVSESASETPVSESASETPASDSETPAPASETPASDSETPASDSEAPASDSETPASDSENLNEGFKTAPPQIKSSLMKLPDRSSLPSLKPNELVLPVFDESVLSQIPNVQNVQVEVQVELDFLKSLPIEEKVEIPKANLVNPADFAEERQIAIYFV